MEDPVRWQPEAAYRIGLVFSAALLASFTIVLGAKVLFPAMPAWSPFVLVSLITVMVEIALLARIIIADYFRLLSHNERLVAYLVPVGFFVFPTLVMQHWSPLAGLLAMQVPAILTLVSERGFARFYMLCGITCLLALSGVELTAAVLMMAGFCCMVTVCLAYDHFFHTVEGRPGLPSADPWRPLWLSLPRAMTCAGAAAMLLWITPHTQPFLITPKPRQEEQIVRRSAQQDFDFSLMKAFLYTMLTYLFLLAMVSLYRYLRSRRKQREAIVESIGVPVGEARRLERTKHGMGTVDLDDPRQKVFYWYERFSRGLSNEELHRGAEQTPREYLQFLLGNAAVSRKSLVEITNRLERARYTTKPVSSKDADRFTKLIQETMQAMDRAFSSQEKTEETEDSLK